MGNEDNEPFSNPSAPDSKHHHHHPPAEERRHPLTNDDFRKLMMTPRPGQASAAAATPFLRPSDKNRGQRRPILSKDRAEVEQPANENKTKKKKFYQAMKQQEDDTLAELASRYRDRARERRDGANPDYNQTMDDATASIGAYRAVAPDGKTDNAAQRRKQIEESKFLGGDMEHTHLVKGLDYALLQKVKAEIAEQVEDDDEAEEGAEPGEFDDDEDGKSRRLSESELAEPDEDAYRIKSVLASNIVNFLNHKLPERNDLFLPSRMAYVVDLSSECIDDIPTTVIRSRADCPNGKTSTALSTNDIVIGKLVQILSFLRTSGGKKKDRGKAVTAATEKVSSVSAAEADIKKVKQEKLLDLEGGLYGEDVGAYEPSRERKDRSHRDKQDRHHADKERDRSHSYFERSERDRSSAHSRSDERSSGSSSSRKASSYNSSTDVKPGSSSKAKLSSVFDAPADSYAECYPGAPENDDAVIDSDEEVDYTKMDMGNKKGNINRWDFDTAEEYSDFMNNKEALPKAAFQYGMKISDGRKTRGKPKPGSDKKDQKLEKDLQKINAIISKRKADSAESGARKINFQADNYKRSKY